MPLRFKKDCKLSLPGGTVFHTFLGERISDWETTQNLVKKIAENYRVPYYTISPTYSICPTHGYITGEVYECIECGKETEVYSRITGYYRPIKHWNDGKKSEYTNRKEYVLNETKNVESENDKVILFTAQTCPNCPKAKEELKEINIEHIDAHQNIELAQKFGIRTVPTLVVVNGDDSTNYVGLAGVFKI